jgi:SecD/SecF fusion protein
MPADDPPHHQHRPGSLFILGALYLLGGESLQDFALALIVGIVVGTYGSVFTAAPLSVQLDKLRPAPAVVKKRPAGRPQPSRARR